MGKVAEGMVAGDTVNTASRVQGAAPTGTVLVDEATWRASSAGDRLRRGRRAHAQGQVRDGDGPGGRSASSASAGASAAASASSRRSSARDDELRLVKDLLQATARERRARLVSVTGVPGIGKSRLAWEFLKYVDGLAETVYWHQGRSRRLRRGRHLRGARRDGADAGRDHRGRGRGRLARQARRRVAEHFTDDEERRWIEPRLAHLLGLAEAPAGDREELFSAWRTFFERIADSGPTVLVFEDLPVGRSRA